MGYSLGICHHPGASADGFARSSCVLPGLLAGTIRDQTADEKVCTAHVFMLAAGGVGSL